MTLPYPRSSALVIDASVLRGAGETEHPVSGACRDFLEMIRAGSFRVATSPELKAERDRHASRFASRWFNNMVATKRLILLEKYLCCCSTFLDQFIAIDNNVSNSFNLL